MRKMRKRACTGSTVLRFLRCAVRGDTSCTAQREKNGKKKILLVLLALAAVAVIAGVVLYFTLDRFSLELKYDWGTQVDTILENETLAERYGNTPWPDPDGMEEVVYDCVNPDGYFSNITGFTSNYVSYFFQHGKLRFMQVQYREAYGFRDNEEAVAQMEESLGTKHFDNWIRKYRYVWWLKDTVIILDAHERTIYFYEAGYFEECFGGKDDESYLELAEFFGK